ncbi:MAG: hypothetical protein LBI41_01890 [Lactobacillales bacterium]|nr:hypothetical protein [Lactobacillales bacterium]
MKKEIKKSIGIISFILLIILLISNFILVKNMNAFSALLTMNILPIFLVSVFLACISCSLNLQKLQKIILNFCSSAIYSLVFYFYIKNLYNSQNKKIIINNTKKFAAAAHDLDVSNISFDVNFSSAFMIFCAVFVITILISFFISKKENIKKNVS